MLHPNVASAGMTLYASLPEALVKAMVVCIIAPAWALMAGRALSNTGLNSQRFPKTSLSGNDAYGARALNMAATSLGIFRLNGCPCSNSATKSLTLARGEFFFGALE